MTKGDRPVREFILVSLCAVLATSSRAAPEQIDEVLRMVVNSFEPRYLDRLKRGARFANVIISELASRLRGDEMQRLDRATQIILQGICSPSESRRVPQVTNAVKLVLRYLSGVPSTRMGTESGSTFHHRPCQLCKWKDLPASRCSCRISSNQLPIPR